MSDRPFGSQPFTPDDGHSTPVFMLVKVKEYLEGPPPGVEIARCVRTSKADGSATDDGSEDIWVVVTSHVAENMTLIAVRITPDTGYERAGGYRYVWQQLAGGGNEGSGQYKDEYHKMVSQNQSGWAPITARAM